MPDPVRRRRTRARILGGVCALAAIVALAWALLIRPNLAPANFGTVVEGRVYRSAQPTPAALARVVRRHGIRSIIDLGAHEPGTAGERRAQRAADALGLRRLVLNLEGDGTGDPNDYVRALRFAADPDNQPVLVTCATGSQRTSCFVMLYRHIVEGREYGSVYAEARRHGQDPRDNPYVLLMIADFGDEIARAFRTGEPIAWSDPRGARPDRDAGSHDARAGAGND